MENDILIQGVAASALITFFVQFLKKYLPGLHGRRAMGAVDGITLLVALYAVEFELAPFEDDWHVSVGVFLATWISLSLISRGIYAQFFKETT